MKLILNTRNAMRAFVLLACATNTAFAQVAPPTISKAFNAANISLNDSTGLIFTITNPAANTVAATGVAFSDTLPSGLVVANVGGMGNSCGGTLTAVVGSSTISLSGGTVGVSCTVSVNVT